MLEFIEREDATTSQKYIDIYIIKGDTLLFKIDPIDSDGNPIEIGEGDVIRFACKKTYNDEECLIIKEIPNDTLTLRVDSIDTKKFEVDKKGYVYDIQLTDEDGIVDTFISGVIYPRNEVE